MARANFLQETISRKISGEENNVADMAGKYECSRVQCHQRITRKKLQMKHINFYQKHMQSWSSSYILHLIDSSFMSD